MSIRVLFMDDESQRHFSMAVRARARHWYMRSAYSVEALKMILREECWAFDVISLDHDMGGTIVDGVGVPDPNDGRAAARFIATEWPSLRKKPGILVHSWNVPMAEEMAAILNAAKFNVKREPFKFGGAA